MRNIPPSCILNADQSGFAKQLHSNRTLAPVGVRKVTRVVQAVASTTHSYTVLPIIFADGRLHPKLFVVFAEPKGQFPASFRNTSSNLVVKCHISHIMTKKLCDEWLRECVFASEMPEKVLLLLDQWTPFRDHDAIKGAARAGTEVLIKNIPAGATSQIQPLDVYFFRVLKDFVRKVHEHVMAECLDFIIHQRTNILLVLEVVWNQFCNPIFKDFLLYSWRKIGYIETEARMFQTPVEACLKADMPPKCENLGDCVFRPSSLALFVKKPTVSITSSSINTYISRRRPMLVSSLPSLPSNCSHLAEPALFFSRHFLLARAEIIQFSIYAIWSQSGDLTFKLLQFGFQGVEFLDSDKKSRKQQKKKKRVPQPSRDSNP